MMRNFGRDAAMLIRYFGVLSEAWLFVQVDEMPKIVETNGNWKAVDVPGEFAFDGNLAFLSSFEECVPTEHRQDGFSPMIEKKVKKRRASDSVDQLVTNGFMQKKKKIKKSEKLVEFDESITVKQISSGHNEKMKSNTEKTMDGNNEGNGDNQLHQKEMEVSISGWTTLNISSPVLKAITDMRFAEPTEIQKLVIPSAVRDRFDIIGAAETEAQKYYRTLYLQGSGKTLAFGVPVIEHLLANQSSSESSRETKSIRALILAPTRELVMQIKNHIHALLKYTPFRIASVVGGLSLQKQERILKYVPEIVVATPGRFLALMTSASADSCLSNWCHLQCLVIDETDRMIEKGHFEDLQQILDTLKKKTSKKLQTFVFSATLTYAHPGSRKHGDMGSTRMNRDGKIVRFRFTNQLLYLCSSDKLIEITGIRKEKHKIIDITGERGTAEAVVEARINCKNLLEKDTSLVYLLNRYAGRTLVFTNSIDASRRLHGILKQFLPLGCLAMLLGFIIFQLKHNPLPLILHAKMMQRKRLINLEKFAMEENSVLLATDVAARGLDIRDVEHVIHYQVPKTAEIYIHRCGRTARAAKEGLAVLLIDSQDVHYYQKICKNLGRETELPIFPVDSPELYSVLEERVEVAVAVEALEHRMKKMHSKQTWFEKAAASADLDLDGCEYKKNTMTEMNEDLQKEKKALLIRLTRLLSHPLPANYVPIKKTRYVTSEIALNYGKSSTRNAIESLIENVEHEELLKRRCRGIYIRHLKKSRKKKRKKFKK
uniref:ATP-dependent RNA helicase n=1 Tax=Setaria digitata TaxID=48799 RepID=A0A915PY16_9BILA